MCDELRHCKDCGYCIAIGKTDAIRVCNALPYVGAWQRFRKQVILAVGYALRCHGICAWRLEIVDKEGMACEEFWKDEDGDRHGE